MNELDFNKLNKYLDKVYNNMRNHLDEQGHVVRVTKASRKAAVESAKSLGLTHAEHGHVMTMIHELHREPAVDIKVKKKKGKK